MTKKLLALVMALCLVLGATSALAEKLTVTAWDANFNGNALKAAYARLQERMGCGIDRFDGFGFGTFISGPSKTADIAQVLVMGAQAARTATVLLLDE